MPPDMINHPAHYTMGKHEVIDVLWNWELSFCLGNAVKYIARAQHKGNQIQDLEKAIFYLNYERDKTDQELEHTDLSNIRCWNKPPVQEVIDDWKLGRHCGHALRDIYVASHNNLPHSYLGLAVVQLTAEIEELRKKF